MLASGGDLRIEHTEHAGCTVVRPSGTLNVDNYPEVRDRLLKHAAEVPKALIVVMDELRLERDHLLSVFSLVWMRLADWPGIPVLLVAHDQQRRRVLGHNAVSRYTPVHPGVAEAEASLADEPTRRRVRQRLHDTATASARGRALARKVCAQWGVDEFTTDATMVATELVENSLKHTDSSPTLRLELRRGLLSVAVTDDSPTPAVLREFREQPGAGLWLIAQTTRLWGCTPTLAGGKVVWAVLEARGSGTALSGREWNRYAG